MTRILIVEDSRDLAFGLRRTLEFEGYGVEVAEDGPSGLALAQTERFGLIVLDLMLPQMGGFEILRALRGGGSTVPILVLTARGEEADVLMGLDSGADDYVTKPFSTLEVLARVRALLRRGGPDRHATGREAENPDGLRFGDVEVDVDSRLVRKSGRPVELTPKEFDLLVALLRREGAVVSRTELLGEVWQYANRDVMTRTVDIHIAELRRKLENDPSRPRHLLTVRKAGWRS